MVKKHIFIISLSLMIASCGLHSERVVPVPLPDIQAEHIDVDGVLFSAKAYVNQDNAEAAFGFDIRGAGLLPVRIAIDNQSNAKVKLIDTQTFLIDHNNQAWPLLTAKMAHERITTVTGNKALDHNLVAELLLKTAGVASNLAIGVFTGGVGTVLVSATKEILTGSINTANSEISKNKAAEKELNYDLEQHSLRDKTIDSGLVGYGFLFFPGLEEARSAQTLRLTIAIDGKPEVVNIPLPPEISN